MSCFGEYGTMEISNFPLISVIIPVYNAENWIGRCIQSIINQVYENLEVIIVNDGSLDNSQRIISDYCKLDSRIIALNQDNQGVSKARETGLKAAKGEFVTFVDADDYIDAKMYSTMVKYIEKDTDIIEAGCRLVSVTGKIIQRVSLQSENIEGGRNCAVHYLKQQNVTNYMWNKLYRREILTSLTFENLRYSEDFYINVLSHYQARKKVIIPGEFYNYVMHSEQATSSSNFSLARVDTIKAGIMIMKAFRKDKEMQSLAGMYVYSYYVIFANTLQQQGYKEWNKYRELTFYYIIYCFLNTKLKYISSENEKKFKGKALRIFLLGKKYHFFEWMWE